MLLFKNLLAEKIKNALDQMNSEHGLDIPSIAKMLEYPPDDKMGDIALPCFKLSKTLRSSPVMIAQKLSEMIEDCNIEKIEAITHCSACGNDYNTIIYGKTCPNCQSSDTYLLQGNEFMIKEMEVY